MPQARILHPDYSLSFCIEDASKVVSPFFHKSWSIGSSSSKMMDVIGSQIFFVPVAFTGGDQIFGENAEHENKEDDESMNTDPREMMLLSTYELHRGNVTLLVRTRRSRPVVLRRWSLMSCRSSTWRRHSMGPGVGVMVDTARSCHSLNV